MKQCFSVLQVHKQDSYLHIETNTVPLRLWFLTDHIVRIRAGFDGDFAILCMPEGVPASLRSCRMFQTKENIF